MNIKFWYTLFLLFIIISISNSTSIYSAKNDRKISISGMLEKYENGDLEYCRDKIDQLASRYKNNSNIFYLKGLISANAEESIEHFKIITKRFKTSSKKSIALKKIEDYNNLKNYLADKNADLSFTKVNNQTRKSNRKIKIIKKKQDKKDFNKYKFTIQLGIFSNLNNANKMNEKYSFLDTFVKVEEIEGKKYNRVLSGKYKTEKEALKRADFLLKRYDIKTIIKELK